MKNKLAVIGQKSLAALTLLFGFAPFFLLAGVYCAPQEPLLWGLLPACACALGIVSFCVKKKARLLVTGVGGALLLGLGGWALRGAWPLGLVLPALCVPLLLMLPPAYGRTAWEEWPQLLWGACVAAHAAALILIARLHLDRIAAAEQACAAAFAFLFVLTLNRVNLRASTHGMQKAPRAVANRNLFLTIALFAGGMLVALWRTLARALDQVLAALKRGVLAVLRFLLSLFPQGGSVSGEGGGMVAPDLGELAEGAETSAFAKLMERFFLIFAYVLLAAAACFILWFLYRKLKVLFKKLLARLRRYAAAASEDYEDEAESTLNLDEKARVLGDRLRRALRPRAKAAPWETLDGGARVRRLYRRYARVQNASAGETAREALAQPSALGASTAAAFADLYDQARYSDHPIPESRADSLRQSLEQADKAAYGGKTEKW